MAKKNKPLPPKGRPTTEPAPGAGPTKAPGTEGAEGFDDMDDFFFGSEAGAFSRDEDYDPFDGPPRPAPQAPAPQAPAPQAPAQVPARPAAPAAAAPSAPPPPGGPTRSVPSGKGPVVRTPNEDDVATSTRLVGPDTRAAVAAGLLKEAGAGRAAGKAEAKSAPAPSAAPSAPALPPPGPAAPASSAPEPAPEPPPAPPAMGEQATVVAPLPAIAPEEAAAPPVPSSPAPPPVTEAAMEPSTPPEPAKASAPAPAPAERDEEDPPPARRTAPELAAVGSEEAEDLPDAAVAVPSGSFPLEQRRAAGALAAVSMAMDQTEVVADDGEIEEPDSGSVAGASREAPDAAGEATIRRTAGRAPVGGPVAPAPPLAVTEPSGPGTWDRLVAELSAEAEAARKSPELRAALLLEAGRILATRVGDWAGAEARFQAAIQAVPTFSPALRELVRLCAGRQEWSRAVDLLSRQAEGSTDGPTRTAALLGAAHIQLSQLDRLPEATADLRRALEVYPDNYIALRFLREIHYRTQDWPALVDDLRAARALAGQGEQLRIDYELGRLHDEVLKSPQAALATFRSCLQIDPRFVPAFLACERILAETGDVAGQVDLWRSAAASWGGADAVFWLLRAARVGDLASLPSKDIAHDYQAAFEASGADPLLGAELRQWLETHGRSEDLVAHCEAELARGGSAERRADILCTLAAQAVQVGGDLTQAVAHLDEALRLDPENVEAQESRRHALASSHAWPALAQHLLVCANASTDLRVRVALLLKVAEVAEVHLDDLDAARAHLEAACSLASNYLPALEALIWVLARLGLSEARAERLEQAAALVDSAEARSAYLLRASRDWERAGRRDRTVSTLKRAAEEGPGTLLAREWLGETLLDDHRWSEAAELYRQAAAESQDTALRVSLLYRSARIALARARDNDAAEVAYRSLLEIVPEFLPATMDLRDLLVSRGDWDAAGLILQLEAEGRPAGRGRAAWHRMAARAYDRSGRDQDALTQHRAALQANPDDHASAAAIRRTLRIAGGTAALADSWRKHRSQLADPGRRDQVGVELALTLVEAGDSAGLAAVLSELGSGGGSTVPWAALGIAAEALGQFTEASRCYARRGELEGTEARAASLFQKGLLAAEVGEDVAEAAGRYEAVRRLQPNHPMACEGLERIYAQTGRTAPLAAIYEAEAAAADTGPVRTFYALLAGEQRENLGDHEAALSAFRMALADPVGRERAIDAVRRLGVQLRRGGLMIEVISEQAETLPAAEQRARLLDLVDGLLSIGDEAGAVGILGDLCKAQPDFIGAWLIREHLHASADQWNDVVTCLEALEKRAASDVLRRRATASLQAVLAERGVTSETAYEYYRSLQEREPENVVALRGLAGIAHARGQFDDAKLYLEEVIRLSKDPAVRADASSLQGQILAEHDGDMAAAVKALEAALQAVPTHRPAIEGLKRVHSSAGNWSALVGVLARESSQAMPERRLAIFIEIAGLWENQIKNLKVATASWQKVLQEDPRNVEAMERLQGLFERMEDWGGFLDLGERVLHRLSGIELRDRQAELGVVAAERAGQVDRGMALLRAAAAADPPSLVAVQALRRLARSRGDWEQVVQLAEQEAELVEGGAEKAALLEEAAHIRLDQVLDREGAAPLFRRVLELDPDNAAALHFFVSWAFDAGEWAAALPVFERYERPVLAMDEDDEDARIEMTAFHYKFGVVLAKNGRPAAALDRFQKALALTPTHLPSLEAAAPCWFAQGDWEKARDIYRTTLRLRGGSGDAGTLNSLYLHLGQAEIKLADATNAQKRFKKILDQNPNHVEALIGLAQVHRLSEDWNSLLSTYNSIIKYARDPDQVIEAYMTKGDVLEQKLQFTDKAVLHYEKVLMYDRANVAAMARLGQIALKRGEGPRAKEMAERAAQSARNVEERALALLLGRLVDAGESVDVAAALYAVRQAGDVDGDVLIAFERATGGSVIDRDAAANAYRDAMRPL